MPFTVDVSGPYSPVGGAPKKVTFSDVVAGLSGVLGALFPAGVLNNNNQQNPFNVPVFAPPPPQSSNNMFLLVVLFALVLVVVLKK